VTNSSAQSSTSTEAETQVADQNRPNCEVYGKVLDKDLVDRRRNCPSAGESRCCRQCGRAFVRQTALEAHEKHCNSSVHQVPGAEEDLGQSVAQPDGRVPCPACTKTFTLERSMRAHFATFHGTEAVPKPFACDVCGRSFVRANLLAVHCRTHTGDRPFQCEICGRRFICRGDLNKHHRLHVDGYMYKCRLCGKEIKTSRESADHRRQHAGGIVCPICGKSFTRYLNMKAHVRGTHDGERRFVCSECGKSFVYAQNLRYHRRAHRTSSQKATTSVTGNSAVSVVEDPRGLPLAPALPLFRVVVVPDVRQDDSAAAAADSSAESLQ